MEIVAWVFMGMAATAIVLTQALKKKYGTDDDGGGADGGIAFNTRVNTGGGGVGGKGAHDD